MKIINWCLTSGELLLENVFETADLMPPFENDLVKYLAKTVKLPDYAKKTTLKVACLFSLL